MSDIRFSDELVVELVDHMGNDLSVCKAAWVSSKNRAKYDMQTTAEKRQALISYLMKYRHGSPFEHNAFQFYVKAPIMVFREWHRHRIGFSYNERSGRYSVLEPEFYLPNDGRPLQNIGSSAKPIMAPGNEIQYAMVKSAYQDSCANAYSWYEKMLSEGICKEIARGILPVTIYTEMYCTCNARSIMHFLGLRTHNENATFISHPQWEINQCANQIETVFSALMPMTYKAFCDNGRVDP